MDIKMFVMDVDGTLTDGKIYMGACGEMYKAFCIKDGYGIRDILITRGIIPVIITGRISKILEKRCYELCIAEIHQGIKDKVQKLIEIAERFHINISHIAYIGDDLNDMPCMKLINENGGQVGCPADAVREIREIADFVAVAKGGDGAVREFIEYLCR